MCAGSAAQRRLVIFEDAVALHRTPLSAYAAGDALQRERRRPIARIVFHGVSATGDTLEHERMRQKLERLFEMGVARLLPGDGQVTHVSRTLSTRSGTSTGHAQRCGHLGQRVAVLR